MPRLQHPILAAARATELHRSTSRFGHIDLAKSDRACCARALSETRAVLFSRGLPVDETTKALIAGPWLSLIIMELLSRRAIARLSARKAGCS